MINVKENCETFFNLATNFYNISSHDRIKPIIKCHRSDLLTNDNPLSTTKQEKRRQLAHTRKVHNPIPKSRTSNINSAQDNRPLINHSKRQKSHPYPLADEKNDDAARNPRSNIYPSLSHLEILSRDLFLLLFAFPPLLTSLEHFYEGERERGTAPRCHYDYLLPLSPLSLSLRPLIR